MVTTVELDEPITLEQAAAFLKTTTRSAWIWVTRGQGGKKLEAWRLGREWRTTIAACRRFLGMPTAPTPKAEQSLPDDYDSAMAELEELGVLPKGGHQGWRQQQKRNRS